MINTFRGTREYQIEAISAEALDAFNNAGLLLKHHSRNSYSTLLKTFECFLQLTNQTLNLEQMRSPKFEELSSQYVGSIYSAKVFELSQKRRYDLLKCFELFAEILQSENGAFPICKTPAQIKETTSELNLLIEKFDEIPLNLDKLWEWERWPCKNKLGKIHWAPLHPIFKRLGKDFTDEFYIVCQEFSLGRRDNGIPCLKALSDFIGQYEAPLCVDNLGDGEFMKSFWREFLTYFMITGYASGSGCKVSTLVTEWRTHFRFFVESYLEKSKLVAKAHGGMPNPPPINVTGAQTNIRIGQDGSPVKIKLLTDIPLYITDEEAMQQLFVRIQTDVDIAVTWASRACEEIWANYQLRLRLSKQGKVYKKGKTGTNTGNYWLKNRLNPDYLKNAAATLEYYGHIDDSNLANNIFPSPLSQTAYELGMPKSGSLLPHCALLVANHPAITASFLENFELYDKDGKLVGLQELDGTYKLVGFKMRRGSRLAQQEITLTEQTHSIVQQIISLTNSVREHLKRKGDDNWRYLLLSCKQGFGYPNRVRTLATNTTLGGRGINLVKSLEAFTALSDEDCLKFAENFDITSLRASCAVLVYLKTKSISEMSKALGHAELDHKLIRRYLPDLIHSFYQDRWIRIFQTGLIVEAMQESEYLLEASGFQTIQEVHLFLRNHALNLPDESHFSGLSDMDTAFSVDSEMVFGISPKILTLLISLQQAVQSARSSVHELAQYWAEFSTQLIKYIESNYSNRPDFQSFLEVAKLEADPLLMESIIYA